MKLPPIPPREYRPRVIPGEAQYQYSPLMLLIISMMRDAQKRSGRIEDRRRGHEWVVDPPSVFPAPRRKRPEEGDRVNHLDIGTPRRKRKK